MSEILNEIQKGRLLQAARQEILIAAFAFADRSYAVSLDIARLDRSVKKYRELQRKLYPHNPIREGTERAES